MRKKPLITLTTDFAVQSQGVGNMEALILDIVPYANVVHLSHGVADFNLHSGARVMEAINYLPVGFHVCVIDPGVGTKRQPIIIQTKRGDFLIGPDNGVLISAAQILGGAKKVVAITSLKYMILPVSPIFHGRHIFAPAAAFLAKGTPIDQFGPILDFDKLVQAPYQEATIKNQSIEAEIIHINKFGSIHLNILHSTWDQFKLELGQTVRFILNNQTLKLPFFETFGQVDIGTPLILKDDFGRIEVAINQGSFAKKFSVKVGDKCTVKKD
ncbi:SAM-dependent chlorinase/fluorinase [Candidatus Daviesbacteria bacterium]|nr:SAM-dependent chlorinase/fluorinase [Candidatus Daviesbacteria bacterium]